MRKIHLDIKEKFSPNPWRVTEDIFSFSENRNNETIFALANGYIGVRGGFDEGYAGKDDTTEYDTMLNGVYTYFDYNHVWARPGYPKRWHSITCQMNPFSTEIYADGERILMGEHVLDYQREINLKTGILTRKYTYKLQNGKTIKLFFERFLSMKDINVGVQKIILSSNEDIEIIIKPYLTKELTNPVYSGDGRKNEKLFTEYQKFDVDGDIISGIQKLKVSNFIVSTSFISSLDEQGKVVTDDLSASIEYKFILNGEKELTRYFSYVSGQNNDETYYLNESKNYVKDAFNKGYDTLKKEHVSVWELFWEKSDIILEGDDSIQQGIRFCLYMVNASCGRDGKTNISANGLMGIGYCGQTFWDTELFIQPMYNYSDPNVTKSLILYRYNLLENAKKRAIEMDDQGALFAWNTINGEECGHVFEAATAQYHINTDIFYAIYKYYEATEDEEFLLNYCAEILFEISKCMAHRGAFIPLKGNKFCINVVCGPDEYTPIVDNNTYTNFLCKKQLEFALEVKELLKVKNPAKLQELITKVGLNDEEFALWKQAADNMYIGYNKELDIITQDDQFHYRDPVDIDYLAEHKYPLLFNLHPLNLWRYQVCKQADLVFLTYIYSHEFDFDMIKRIYDYYEPRTIHDSSLSSSIHAIVACYLGYYNDAYGYLKQASRMDLDNYNKNVGSGIHAACSGGAYQMLVNGYAGLRVYDDKLHFKPVIDPKWTSLEFKIKFKGSLLKIKIYKDRTVYTLLEGKDISLYHGDKLVTITSSPVEEPNSIILEG